MLIPRGRRFLRGLAERRHTCGRRSRRRHTLIQQLCVDIPLMLDLMRGRVRRRGFPTRRCVDFEPDRRYGRLWLFGDGGGRCFGSRVWRFGRTGGFEEEFVLVFVWRKVAVGAHLRGKLVLSEGLLRVDEGANKKYESDR